jgi:FLVCR family MFS transporter 7
MSSTTDNARNGEPAADTKISSIISKTNIFGKEKDISGETMPGWTIMRPLKRKAGKKGSGSSFGDGTKLVETNGNGNESRIDSKGRDDLKVMETNNSGDGYGGVGEVDTLHDLRSDDELLEGEDERAAQHRGNLTDHNLNGNAAEVVRTRIGGVEYKVYKRRWFGLIQLVLLNIVVSWDVSLAI